MSKVEKKRYIVRKYIMATSVSDAIKKDRRTRPDDVWVDEDWKKENPNRLESAMGFFVEHDYYSSDDYAKKK